MLVRPDGYIAWRGDGTELERCLGVLRLYGARDGASGGHAGSATAPVTAA